MKEKIFKTHSETDKIELVSKQQGKYFEGWLSVTSKSSNSHYYMIRSKLTSHNLKDLNFS